MENKNSSAPQLKTEVLFERMLQWLRDNRCPFLTALVVGFFSYMFTFTNKLVIHDDLEHMFNKGFTASSGRWGLDLLSYVLPDVSMPWFHGVLTLLFIALAVCLIVSLLSIRRPLIQALAAGLIICFPSLTGTFGYMFTSSSYGVAFLLAVLSAWGFCRRDRKGLLLGTLSCIFSLSIYQAYISITVTLLVLVLLRSTLYEETPVLRIFFRGLYFIAALILSLGLYWGITSLIQSRMGIPMNSYAQGAISGDSGILSRIINCIKVPLYILLLGYKGLVKEGPVQILHLIFLAVTLLELIFWCIRCRKADRICMLVFLLAVFPFALSAVLLFTSLASAHALVLYGFVGVYLLALVVLQDADLHGLHSLLGDLAVICLAVIIFSNSSTANRASMNLCLRYENNYSMASSLVTRIELTEGFQPDSPVAIIGYLPYTNDYDKLLDVDHLTGVSEHATRAWAVDTFLQRYCGADFRYLPLNESASLIDTPEFQAMPFFPADGSVAVIDGTVVAKLDPWMLPEEYVSRILPDTP